MFIVKNQKIMGPRIQKYVFLVIIYYFIAVIPVETDKPLGSA